jgi:hypothetical protein
MISHEANLVICSVSRSEDRKSDPALLFSLTNHGLLLVCKFLEIWDGFNAMSRDNRRIREVSQAVSPAIRRITKTWPRIREYRNWAIAHPYSMREEEEITPPWRLLEAEVGPVQSAEILVLLDCVRFAAAGVLAYFGEYYRKLAPTFDVPPSPPEGRGVSDGAEAEAERTRIASDLNEKLSGIGVDLRDTVFKEFACPPLRQPSSRELA